MLAALDERQPVVGDSRDELVRWKSREELRIAARDLLGLDPLEATTAAITTLATDVLAAAHRLVAPEGASLAVIGMGKLGGNELNYASDIDLMFVGEGDLDVLTRTARRLIEVARSCYRVDAGLRPEGKAGPLVRSLPSFEAYWDRWAEPWEFQALLKARAVAGDAELGAEFDEVASRRLWSRVFSADDLRAVRQLKARSEGELARRGLTDREVKRGRGGIRDIEFAVQLLQLVHGGSTPTSARRRHSPRWPSWAPPGTSTRRTPANSPTPTASSGPSSTGSSSGTAPRCTRCRRRRGAPPDRPVARAPGCGRCQRRRTARRRPGPPPGHGADDPRAALLPSAPRGLRQRRRGVAEPSGRRRGPAERVRVLRRVAHPRRRPRADQRPHPVVAADAADAAPAPRVARREPRSRSRAAQRAQPGQ